MEDDEKKITSQLPESSNSVPLGEPRPAHYEWPARPAELS